MKRSALLLLGLLLWIAGVAQAGVVVDVEHHEGRGDDKEVTTGRLFLDAGSLKMITDVEDEEEPDLIFQSREKRMLLVDHEEKSYMILDAEAIGEMVEQMQSVRAQMEEALSQLPPDQRKAAEDMMKQRMPAGMGQGEPLEVKVVKLDGTSTKDGKKCTGYEVRVGGQLQSRIWATEWAGAGIGKEDFKPFADMAAFFQELMQAMPMVAPEESQDLFSGLDEVQGFPVVVESFEDGDLVSETFFRNVRQEKLDAATFQPPKDYRAHSMKDQMQGH